MLSLTINDKPLDTDQDFSCAISIKNPFFMFDEIRGPLAADITLPVEGNEGMLNNPNQVTKRASQNDRHFAGAKLLHFNLPLVQGNLIITGAKGQIEGWIQNYIGQLGEELREKNLTELDYGDDQDFVNQETFDPDSDKWCTIRLMNRGFWKDRGKMVEADDGTDVEDLTNKFEALAGFFVNQNTSGGVITSAAADGVAVVSPFPFLHWLIDTILRKNNFFISDNFLKLDADLKTLCLYHNYNILVDSSTTAAKTVSLINWFSNSSEELDLEAISESTWALGSFSFQDLMTSTYVKNLFLSAQNTFNTFFWFNNNRTVQIIDREEILKGEAFDLSQYRVSKWDVGERKDVCLKFSWEHDDDDSAFKDLYENLDDKREKILESVTSRDDLFSILLTKAVGDIRMVENENTYYEYGWFPISEIYPEQEVEVEFDVLSWKPVSVGLQNYFFNDGDKDQEEIKSNFSTLRMASEGYPIAYQNGNSKTFSNIREPFSPRLMFYQGNNIGGDESTSGKKFDWKGDAGFLFNRWRLTAPFLAGRLPIEADFRFPPRILSYVMNNVYQKFKDSECEFLIEQLDGNPGPEEETLVRIQAYKVEDNYWAFNPGEVIGGGDGTEQTIVPKFVGVNPYGKPYLVDEAGKFKTTSIFGDISTAAYAHHCCVDYDASTNQLFVGGNYGYVHIYDLSDGIRMQSIRMGSYTDSISGLKVANGKVLVGINNQRTYCHFPLSSFDTYSSVSISTVTGSGSEVGYSIRDWEYYGGYYYHCSAAGEIMRCDSNFTNPTEITDRDTEFICMTQTYSRMYIFGDDEREFTCLLTDPTDWEEFRMVDDGGTSRPPIWDAKSKGETAYALTTQFTNSLFILSGPNVQERIGIGGYAMGLTVSGSDVFVANGSVDKTSSMLYKLSGSDLTYQFDLPDCMSIFGY